MLRDPENPYEEWEDTVWAPNQDAARSQCERIAEEYDLTEVINVTQAVKKQSKSGNYKFICWFRTEIKP
ncbi:MAG: hypothetical protein KME16_27560 [Scytolyngbya sp. HA4215-MV1]|nr:hypothetical protein [Scytolyngbya sp. HA4215-MV1]